MRSDLVLLTCGNKRYVIKQNKLSHCIYNNETILCVRNLFATVESPNWLVRSKMVSQFQVVLPSRTFSGKKLAIICDHSFT